MRQPGVPVRRPHLVGLGGVDADRFFAEQVFSGLGAGHHRLVMQRIRRGDDDKVDILMTDNLTPVIGQQPGAILLPRLIKQITPTGA